MSEAKKITIKLLVDTSNNRVLFAEAGKDGADFIFHILSLPLGTVVSFLTKESMVGSIGALYGSLEKLDTDYVQDDFDKESLLDPEPTSSTVSQVPLLDIDIKEASNESNEASNESSSSLIIIEDDDDNDDDDDDDSGAHTFYVCSGNNEPCHSYYSHLYVSDTEGAFCPRCECVMSKSLNHVPDNGAKTQRSNSLCGYVKGATYMIMDDLSVEPMTSMSSMTFFQKHKVQDLGGVKERVVSLDRKLAVALLKASLMSKTVLTDVFLGEKADGNN